MNDEEAAIDYRTLYRQEKQKALRRQKEEKLRAAAAASTDDDDHSKTSRVEKQESSSCCVDVIGAVLSKSDEPQQDPVPSEVLASRYSPLSVNPLSRQYDCVDPTGVFYKARFLEDIEFQTALIGWLKGLPANYSNHKSNYNSSSPGKSQKDEEELQALGRWTFLPHARRRVALFDARRRPLPSPLQIIVDAVTPYFVSTITACADDANTDNHLHRNTKQEYPPNHLLINEYEPHQGIMAHTDGPAYAARTATISLGTGSVLLQFTPRGRAGTSENEYRQHQPFQIVLEGHGSLIFFEDEAYSSLQHSIDEDCTVEYAGSTCRNADDGAAVRRDYRISITIRHKYESS